jgi:tartrate-resistant acid phosphatase type 5
MIMLKTAALTVLFIVVSTLRGLSQDEAPRYSADLRSTGSPQPIGTVRFAVIGDYGNGGIDAGRVAKLVKSWNPDFIATVGDNNYAGGKCCGMDKHVGKFYQEYIFPYRGIYGEGATINRFFPALGDHDWEGDAFQSYIEFFTLPGNERYYDVAWGAVHIFVLDSSDEEPDGNTSASPQGNWLREKLTQASEPWKLIFLHHPPYSSGSVHGSKAASRWPFRTWGATATFSGNDHLYERLTIDQFPYFVNGLGGVSKYDFKDPWLAGSQVRYNENYGAQLVTASACTITFEFYSIEDSEAPIDSYTISRCADF